MSHVRSGHLLFGVGLVVMGYAVIVIAFAKQAQRPFEAATGASVDSAAAPSPEPSPAQRAAPTPAAAPTPGPSSAASSAAVLGSEPDAQDARMFRFSSGGAIMAREEIQRLLTLGKALARRPASKVSIEAFGDLPGSEPVMVGIAKHRAKVAQLILAKAGVSEDRMTATVVDMGSDLRLARSIRVTTLPPLSSEGEKP